MLPLQWEHGFLGFSYPKINDLSIIFLNCFKLFPEPIPKAILGGPKCRPSLKRAFLEPLWDFRGPKIDPWAPFLVKK